MFGFYPSSKRTVTNGNSQFTAWADYFFFLYSVKVLFLHQHFKTPYTGGAIRSYYLAKALVDRGGHAVIITAHNQKEFKREIVDGIEVNYLPISYDNRFGFYKRAFSFVRFVYDSVKLASQYKDAELCYAISVPLTVGIAARMIRFRFGIPYVFEVGDLWPDAPVQMGFVKNKLLEISLYRLEKSIYKNALSIIALSPAIQESIEGKVPGKKVHLIPNMADTEFYKLTKKDEALELKFNVKGKFVISYIGAMGVANGLDQYLAYACLVQKTGLPIHFLLAGDGACREEMITSASKSGLQNFSILPFQKRDGVREIMNVTDAIFVSYKPVPILETGSPNKYFDGLAAGKLILINFGGWIKQEIEKEKCGVYIDPKKQQDFVDKISPFVNDMERLTQYQMASRLLAERQYSRKKLSDRFVQLLQTFKETGS